MTAALPGRRSYRCCRTDAQRRQLKSHPLCGARVASAHAVDSVVGHFEQRPPQRGFGERIERPLGLCRKPAGTIQREANCIAARYQIQRALKV